MAEAEVESFWQRQRLAEAEVKKPHISSYLDATNNILSYQYILASR